MSSAQHQQPQQQHAGERLYQRAIDLERRRAERTAAAATAAVDAAAAAVRVNAASRRMLERPRSASVASRPALHKVRPEVTAAGLAARKAAAELAACTFSPTITSKASRLSSSRAAYSAAGGDTPRADYDACGGGSTYRLSRASDGITGVSERGGGTSASGGRARVSASSREGSAATGSATVFTALYADSARIEAKRAAKRAALQQAELAAAPFKPAVNPHSSALAQARSFAGAKSGGAGGGGGGSDHQLLPSSPQPTAAERLYAEARQTAARLAAKRAALEAQCAAACTFTPAVDARSRQLAARSASSGFSVSATGEGGSSDGASADVFSRLHGEAKAFEAARVKAVADAVAAQRAEDARLGKPAISERSRQIAAAARSVMAHLQAVAVRYAGGGGGGVREQTDATAALGNENEHGGGGDGSSQADSHCPSVPPHAQPSPPPSSSSVFERLYAEATTEGALAALRTELADALAREECTFRPSIMPAGAAAAWRPGSAGARTPLSAQSRPRGSAAALRLPRRSELAGSALIGAATPLPSVSGGGTGGRRGSRSGGADGDDSLARPSVGSGSYYRAGLPSRASTGQRSASLSTATGGGGSGSVRPWSAGGGSRSLFAGSAASTATAGRAGRAVGAGAGAGASVGGGSGSSRPYTASRDIWSELSGERKDTGKLAAIAARLEAAQCSPVPNLGAYTFAAVADGRVRRATSAAPATGSGGSGGGARRRSISSAAGSHNVVSGGLVAAAPGSAASASNAAAKKPAELWDAVVFQVQNEIAAGASPGDITRAARAGRGPGSAVASSERGAGGALRRLSVDEAPLVSPSRTIHDRLYKEGVAKAAPAPSGGGSSSRPQSAASRPASAAPAVGGRRVPFH